jgi:predicted DNA-binding transcriptional regulator AlpA
MAITKTTCIAARTRVIKLPEVLRLTGLGRSALYARIKAGDFVRPVRLGQRSVGFLLNADAGEEHLNG